MNHNEGDEVANKGVGGLHEQIRKNQEEKATMNKDASQRKEDVLSNFKCIESQVNCECSKLTLVSVLT